MNRLIFLIILFSLTSHQAYAQNSELALAVNNLSKLSPVESSHENSAIMEIVKGTAIAGAGSVVGVLGMFSTVAATPGSQQASRGLMIVYYSSRAVALIGVGATAVGLGMVVLGVVQLGFEVGRNLITPAKAASFSGFLMEPKNFLTLVQLSKTQPDYVMALAQEDSELSDYLVKISTLLSLR